jgi:hypothetical protein
MKHLLSFLILTISTSVFATVECKISTIKDAKNCMNDLAEVLPEYEQSNDGFASKRLDLFEALLKMNGYGKKKIASIMKDVAFVGGIVSHQDEHVILYYTMKKGGQVSPVEVFEINVADLESLFSDDPESTDVKTYFLGTNGKNIDVYEEITERISDYVEHVE